MAIGSGMGSSFGIAVQTASYTTRVAPDTFFVANSYSINRTQNRVQVESTQSREALGKAIAEEGYAVLD